MKANYLQNTSFKLENYTQTQNDLYIRNKNRFLAENKLENFEKGKNIIDSSHKYQKPSHKRLKQNTKSTITVSPILQPQQPQNYLNLSKQNKHVSIISCRSQPTDMTVYHNNGSKEVFMKRYQQKDRNEQHNYHENDNKKTRKYFIKSIESFHQTAKNIESQYYKVADLQNLRKQKTLKHINFKDTNQNTLSMRKSPCQHKRYKQQKQHLKSLQKISNRISFCEAYIELSERKTNFLSRQIDYLLKKDLLRESKKHRKVKPQQLNHCYSQRVIDHQIELFNPVQYLQKSKRQECNHKQMKYVRQQNNYHSQKDSSNRFHFRSNDNKSSSRMKQLIYYHEKQKNHKNYSHKNHSKQKKNQNHQFHVKNYKQTSIYCSRDHNKDNCKNIMQRKKKNQLKFIKNTKSNQKLYKLKQKNLEYEENSDYLLLEEGQQNNSTQIPKNINFNHILPGSNQVPYINSQNVSQQQNSHLETYQEDQKQNGSSQNIYLTRQFELTSAKRPIVQKIKDASQRFIRQKKIKQNTQKFIKSENRPQTVVDSVKSSQKFKQKQFTFVNHDQSNKRFQISSNYEVIESNFNSSKKFNQNTSQIDSRQSQLIEEFNELVVAATKQETPIKKKIIQEQIFRTSKELKSLDEKKVKSEFKNYAKNQWNQRR